MEEFGSSEISDVDAEKNAVILDTYLDSADQDYLVARWAFLNELYSNFCWNAAQAVEKYLKCILLFHKISVRSLGHNIIEAFRLVSSQCPDVIIPEFYDKGKFTSVFGIRCSDDTPANFIASLNEVGDPDIRYMQLHHSVDWTDLMKLDQLVFSLRKYCQDPTPWQPSPDWKPILPLKEAQSKHNWLDVRFIHPSRLLNKLREDFKKQDPLRSVEYNFLFLNVPFAGFVPGRAMPGVASRTSAIRRIIDRHSGEFTDTIVNEDETGEILHWLLENFGLSKKTRTEIERLLSRK